MAGSVIGLDGRRAQVIAFLIDAYDGVRPPPGKGLPHAQAVADVLRESGYDEHAQILGLLHDVVEDTRVGDGDVRAAFGAEVADMVAALTEDDAIDHYLPRKRDLRRRIVAAGPPVVDVSLADKIASLRYALLTGRPISGRKLAHYGATLQLALRADAPRLSGQLEELLARFT